MTAQKLCKLWVHKRNFSDTGDDILINTKEFPDVTPGDVVEIYHPEDEYSRLLLQITDPAEDFQQKDTVSIEQSIAAAFQLRAYKDVYVSKVDPKNVALDLVEILFKDQYYSRSDMWRMRNVLLNTCAYLNKKISAFEMRAQVNELRSKGDRVTCGVITEDTNIVFRSSTAVVQIFIQMSSEMWDFDINGDLYFEKAVNGFLMDLFAKWQEQNCLHDVTIVLFSRTYYDAHYIEEFPNHMRDCLQRDYKGRYYEDFYRVVVQNERYEDWTSTIKKLRKFFSEYPERILKFHQSKGQRMPKPRNSTAAQGNFLETLNMALNLFENYYIDRNFDRTGKVAVVITPGPGVFEVDRELTNITKQRTIDCGVGSDLVCMGEQPLHAAPLFKFHSKSARTTLEVGDDYNIPHWMNHSFYTSKNQIQARLRGSFIPRIKPPPEIFEKKPKSKEREFYTSSYDSDDNNFPFVDYDEYDAQVFKLPAPNFPRDGFTRSNSFYHTTKSPPKTLTEAKQLHKPRNRHISDEFMGAGGSDRRSQSSGTSPAISVPSRSNSGDDMSSSVGCYPVLEKTFSRESSESSDSEDKFLHRPIVGSAGSPVSHSRNLLHNTKRSRRALINPFAPSRMQFKMTSYRRRWVHAFPRDPRGAAVQTHHVHTYNTKGKSEQYHPTKEVIQAGQIAIEARKQRSSSGQENSEGLEQTITGSIGSSVSNFSPCNSQIAVPSYLQQGSSVGSYGFGNEFGKVGNTTQKSSRENQKSWLWGPTGEQEWSPDMTTGQDWRPLESYETNKDESRLIKPILTPDNYSQNFCVGISVDWKSLTIPASLPITTDYFPDKHSLQNDFVVSDYSLVPDDVNSEYHMNPPMDNDEKYYRKTPLSTAHLFQELLSQRLAQGFQLIVKSKPSTPTSQVLGTSPQYSHTSHLVRARPRKDQMEKYYLSIGRIFHKIAITGSEIFVTRWRPRHPQPEMKYSYRYRFQCPDSPNYDVSWSEFKNEKLENYNWNYLDQYICTRGESDYGLIESLKYWRSRYFLLPCNNTATKKIIEGNDRCDIYEPKSSAELQSLIAGFVRYVETLNKIRRTAKERRPKHSGETPSASATSTPTGEPGASNPSDTASSNKETEMMTTNTPLNKVIEGMLDEKTGLPFLSKQPGLPHNCFISYDAVDWVKHVIFGVKTASNAVAFMQRLLDDHLICHAGGNPQHKYINGFYLYYIKPTKDKSKQEPEKQTYNSLFQNEWCEVSVVAADEAETKDAPMFHLHDAPRRRSDICINPDTDDWRAQSGIAVGGQGWGQQSATLLHKYVTVDVDSNGKSNRPEWGTARYHAYFSPNCAFELQIQWMVATGCILGDLVYSWTRKASTCGFHLLPVPVDPFALPQAPDSDPLRGPIFVPMNISCLTEGNKPLFNGHDQDTRSKKIVQFLETIIKRYGFLPSSVCSTSDSYNYSNPSEEHQQYVHCTGGMFVLIEASQITSPVSKDAPYSSGSFGRKSTSEMRKDYIARQTSRTSQPEFEVESRIGYLWAWNFMLSKRWRSGNTGDEYFQDKLYADVKAFCSNKDNRLKEFWEDYKLTYCP